MPSLFFISLAYSKVNSFDCFYGFSCKKCITFAIEKNEESLDKKRLITVKKIQNDNFFDKNRQKSRVCRS